MVTASLLSLPLELLEHIVAPADLPLPQLFAVAMTCKTLKEFCLPIHLQRSGIVDAEELCSVVIPDGPKQIGDALSALYQATWVAKTKRLEFHFQAEHLASLKTTPFHLIRIEALILRLSSVEEIVFDFKRLRPPFGDLSYKDVVSWSYAMGRLLSTIADCGCAFLEINGVHQNIQPAHPQPSAITRLYRFFKPVAEDAAKVVSPQRQVSIRTPSSTPPTSALTHLTIGSSSLLCQPLLHWTHSTLSNSHIIHLTIRDIWLPEPQSSTFIALFRQRRGIPTVTHLQLHDLSMSSEDCTLVGQLLSAFPRLQSLSMDTFLSPWRTNAHRSVTGAVLRQLAPGFVLQPLKSVTILRVADHWFHRESDVDAFEATFPRLNALTVLLTDMRLRGRTVLHTLSNQERVLRFTVKVEADIPYWPLKFVRWMSEQTVHEEFQCVSSILVVLNGTLALPRDDDRGGREAVRAWFNQFPAVKDVRVHLNELGPTPLSRFEGFFGECIPEVLERVVCLKWREDGHWEGDERHRDLSFCWQWAVRPSNIDFGYEDGDTGRQSR